MDNIPFLTIWNPEVLHMYIPWFLQSKDQMMYLHVC